MPEVLGLQYPQFFHFSVKRCSSDYGIDAFTSIPGCLRSRLIPESHRATVTNWFRVPMNLITCVTLLAVNHPAVAADKRAIFAACTILLLTGTLIAAKFRDEAKSKRE